MKISIVINVDTRPQNDTFGGSNMLGCVNEDFIIEGVRNKIKFFDGFDKEVIVVVDEHNELDSGYFRWLNNHCDIVCVRRHTNELNFNDWNYIRGLQLASGDIIAHFDQDTVAFAPSKAEVEYLLGFLEEYDFVSYPSYWCPLPVHDDSFDHVWCSTRFFICERQSLDIPEIIKCQNDYDYWCEKYPVARRCHWVEHLIGSIAKYRNQSVYYPPLSPSYTIFSWDKYVSGVLPRLNQMSYEEVVNYVNGCGGIHYPVDISAKPI
jgi:hypothetical protein